MRARLACLIAATLLTAGAGRAAAARAGSPHNILLFVPDGLRSTLVDARTAPAMAALARRGVAFPNSHAMFPTFTTPNASAMATGHALGDTGDFSNTIFTGFPVAAAHGSVTPFLENDRVLGEIDGRFTASATDPDRVPNSDPDENAARAPGTARLGYLDSETILAAARAQGYSTAAVGKLGPTAIFDHANSTLVADAARDARGVATILVDDRTGAATGIPLSAPFAASLRAAGLPEAAPARGANGNPGDSATPGTTIANAAQQDYFVQVATQVLLPQFKAAGRPFVMVFWSRDPDGTQHNQGDSLNRVTPGINGATSLAGVANADRDLSRLLDALDAQDLAASTDVIVAADHGFSTIAKTVGPDFVPSATSYAAKQTYVAYHGGVLAQDVPGGFLPPGMLAIDLAHALGEPLFDPDGAPADAPQPVTPAAYPPVDPTRPPAEDGTRRQRPTGGNGVIGADPANPDLVVAANGGSDLIYLPNPGTAAILAPRVIDALLDEDYVSGLFVDDALGAFPGTLPLGRIDLTGAALPPRPAIVVNFASHATLGKGCVFSSTLLCAAEVADTGLQQGQGMHGTFSRADTNNFMAAAGPDFRAGFSDPAPVSNADIGKTIAQIMRLTLAANGQRAGRVIAEALTGGSSVPAFGSGQAASEPAANGKQTILRFQTVGGTTYFDSAGFAGSTVTE